MNFFLSQFKLVHLGVTAVPSNQGGNTIETENGKNAAQT